MAAYDWGAGNVQRAVQKTGYADFWELYKRHNLPGETQNYVPEILAAIIIANHPTQYGFDEITLDPPVLTDTVTINYAVDLRLVSDLVDAPVDELMALNPSLLRMATPPETAFDLHLPAGAALVYQQRIAGIPESRRTAWRYHRVTPDDSLASVAHTYHVTVTELAAANQLHADQSVSGIEALVVPVAPVAAPSLHALLYTTRRGDTLVSIADRFGVSLDQLRRWNKIPSGIKVEPGRRLHVAEPAAMQRTSSSHRRGSTSSHNAKHGSAASPAARGGDPPSEKQSASHKSQPAAAKSYAKKQK
jgi:membrane-bound lytic murein transglycosylase D